jgi:hypothetical protein
VDGLVGVLRDHVGNERRNSGDAFGWRARLPVRFHGWRTVWTNSGKARRRAVVLLRAREGVRQRLRVSRATAWWRRLRRGGVDSGEVVVRRDGERRARKRESVREGGRSGKERGGIPPF